MAKKPDRFITTHYEGLSITDSGSRRIIVDTKTGVNYLFVKSEYGAGLTPLLTPEGKPVVTPVEKD